MKNPTMLYRCPGPETFEGVQCETVVVEDEDVAAHKDDGWHADWMQAHAAYQANLGTTIKANDAELAEIDKKLEAAGLRAVHKGRGKYDVLDGEGNVVASGLNKDEAQAKAGG